MTRYDDEIRELEMRLQRERAALAAGVDEAARRARSTAERARASVVSPRGLLGALAVGYLLGELTRRPRRVHRREPESTVPRKIGMGSLLGGAALALIRAQYGSPVAFARAMWGYVAEWRAARAAMAGDAADDPCRFRHVAHGGPTNDRNDLRWPPS